MEEYRLRTEIGTLLQRHRLAARRSRAELGRAAGTSGAVVTQVERGSPGSDLELVQSLFAGLDLRLRLRAEWSGAAVDAELDRLALHPAAKRLVEWEWVLAQLDFVGAVVDGPVAALLHGVPLPADALDLALTPDQSPGLAEWLHRHNAMRWSDRRRDFGPGNPDPAVPGPLHWRVGVCEIRATVSRALPVHVTVEHAGARRRVRPLTDIELDDPVVAGLLHRWRHR